MADGPRIYLVAGTTGNMGAATIGKARTFLPHHDRGRIALLLSYYYYRTVDLDTFIPQRVGEPYPAIFLDSGAFTAMTQGDTIDLTEYIAWIKRYRHWLSCYANLDVIRDHAATQRNQIRMEDSDLTPVPVFHVAEPWDALAPLLDYPYVALGVAGTRPSVYTGWLVRAFRMAGYPDHPRTRFHGFGITAWDILQAFPWTTVDSSSWGQGMRFGNARLFDTRRGDFRIVSYTDRAGWYKHADVIRDLGFDPTDYARPENRTPPRMAALAIASYLRAEDWLRDHQGVHPIPEGYADASVLRGVKSA